MVLLKLVLSSLLLPSKPSQSRDNKLSHTKKRNNTRILAFCGSEEGPGCSSSCVLKAAEPDSVVWGQIRAASCSLQEVVNIASYQTVYISEPKNLNIFKDIMSRPPEDEVWSLIYTTFVYFCAYF